MTEATVHLRHPDGRLIEFVMDLDDEFPSDWTIGEHINRQACYEADVAWVLMWTLRAGHKVVDVGACVGFFTLLASQLVGPTGQVVAVEPAVDNLSRLKQNLALNQPHNVLLVEQPLFARSETVQFYHNQDSSGGHALWDPAKWEGNKKTQESPVAPITMGATTLNRIAPSPTRLIKIDTEGAEERVLQGGNNVLLTQHPPFIVAEVNDFGLRQMMCSPDSLRAYMRMHGYDTFMLYPDGARPELVPPRKTVVCEHIWNVLFSTPSDVNEVWR